MTGKDGTAPQQIVIQQQPEPSLWTWAHSLTDAMIEAQVSVLLMVASWVLIAAVIVLPKIWWRK